MKIDPQYEEAYRSAPSEVKTAIVRYMSLSEKIREKTPLLYFILGSGTMEYKMGQAEAKYKNTSNTNHVCGNCIFAFTQSKTGKVICSQIKGEIKLNGICKLWKS